MLSVHVLVVVASCDAPAGTRTKYLPCPAGAGRMRTTADVPEWRPTPCRVMERFNVCWYRPGAATSLAFFVLRFFALAGEVADARHVCRCAARPIAIVRMSRRATPKCAASTRNDATSRGCKGFRVGRRRVHVRRSDVATVWRQTWTTDAYACVRVSRRAAGDEVAHRTHSLGRASASSAGEGEEGRFLRRWTCAFPPIARGRFFSAFSSHASSIRHINTCARRTSHVRTPRTTRTSWSIPSFHNALFTTHGFATLSSQPMVSQPMVSQRMVSQPWFHNLGFETKGGGV